LKAVLGHGRLRSGEGDGRRTREERRAKPTNPIVEVHREILFNNLNGLDPNKLFRKRA
jgi:hypothetical protein